MHRPCQWVRQGAAAQPLLRIQEAAEVAYQEMQIPEVGYLEAKHHQRILRLDDTQVLARRHCRILLASEQ